MGGLPVRGARPDFCVDVRHARTVRLVSRVVAGCFAVIDEVRFRPEPVIGTTAGN